MLCDSFSLNTAASCGGNRRFLHGDGAFQSLFVPSFIVLSVVAPHPRKALPPLRPPLRCHVNAHFPHPRPRILHPPREERARPLRIRGELTPDSVRRSLFLRFTCGCQPSPAYFDLPARPRGSRRRGVYRKATANTGQEATRLRMRPAPRNGLRYSTHAEISSHAGTSKDTATDHGICEGGLQYSTLQRFGRGRKTSSAGKMMAQGNDLEDGQGHCAVLRGILDDKAISHLSRAR